MTVETVEVAQERHDPPLRENLVRALAGVEFRATPSAAGEQSDRLGTLVGVLARYNEWAEINSAKEGHFMERTAPGAFTKTFAENRSRMKIIYDHGMDPHIGRKPLGPLEDVRDTNSQIEYSGPLLPTSYNRDLKPGLEAGLYGSSYRFSVPDDENKDVWDFNPGRSDHNPQGLPERTIKELKVLEFGPTPFPAYEGTSSGVRSVTDDYLKRQLNEPIRAEEAPHSEPAEGETAVSESEPSEIPAVEEPGADPTPVEEPGTEPTQTESQASSTPEQESPAPVPTPEPLQEPRSQMAMTIEERAARQGEIKSRLTEIDTQFAGDVLPDEIRSEWDTLNDEDAQHNRAIDDMQKRQARLLELDGDPKRSVEIGGATRTVSNVIKAPDNVWDLTEYRKRAHGMDDLPELYVEGAKRAVSDLLPLEDAQRAKLTNLLRDVHEDQPGELARRIVAIGSPQYFRAFGKWVTQQPLFAEEQRALATYTNSGADGGYAVPITLDPTLILTDDGVANDIRSIARVESITGQEWKGVTSDAVTVSRVAENTAVTEDAPTLAQPRVVPTSVKGLIKFSIEVGQDWNSLQSEMGRLLADAKAVEESTSFITATGNGITAPQGVVGGLTGPYRITSAAADTFALADLFALTGALPPRFRTARAKFLANRAIYDDVRQFGAGVDVGAGAVWVDSLVAGNPSLLVGYGAFEASSMASTVTSDDDILMFGDFQQFIIVDRVGMSIELIPHMFDGNGAPTGTRGIWAMWRNSSKILVPNAFRLLTTAGS
jgi:HK97 family phage major capsid protein